MTSFNANTTQEQKSRQAGNWLVNISVRWKLNLIIIILLFGFAGIFYSAYIGLQTLQYHISNIYDSMLVPVTSLDRADVALSDIQTLIESLRRSNQTQSEKVFILDRIKDREDFFNEILQRYNENWATTLSPDFTAILKAQNRLDLQQDETTTISTIKSDFDNYLKLRDRLRILVESSGDSNENLLNSNVAAVVAIQTHLRHLTDLTRQFADFSRKAAQLAYTQAIYAMGLVLAISVALGLILAFVVSQSIVNRLGFVTRSALSLQQGHLDKHATTDVSGQDEIAQMAIAFDAMGEQLAQNFSNLEQRVAERTLDLEQRSNELELANAHSQKRANQFQAIAQVGRAITSIQRLEELLPYITRVTSAQLGFYHVGIFLLDKNKEFAVLSAANSEGGKRMLERGHRLKVGQVGIVGYVASMGKPRIALDTGSDAVFFNNPDLPTTHSEMALPLNVESEIIGVLDVQSEQTTAFDEEDVELLAVLADQVSLAIQNARRFQDAQERLKEAQTLYQQFLRQEWKAVIDEGEHLGYRYSSASTLPLKEPVTSSEITDATRSGKISTIQENSQSRMAIPIILRGQTIGILNLRTNEDRAWEQDEIDIAQAVAERVALAVENARLLENSQNQASKERVIGEISTKISAATDMDNILKTALGELGNVIPDTDIFIQFASEEDSKS
jgi:GAF domain-containing protein/HAMP domain-containing protein